MNLVFDNNTIYKANRLPNTAIIHYLLESIQLQYSHFSTIRYRFTIIH